MSYKINFIKNKFWYINLELKKYWKVETFCDTNISEEFLYKFWEDYVEKISRNLIKEIEKKEEQIKHNKLFNLFALSFFNWFWANKILSLQFKNFYNWIFLSNIWNNVIDNSDRIAWAYFNICQFLNKQWFLNASSKLNSLKSDYKKLNESIYIDNLYFKYIESIDKFKTKEKKDLISIKQFQYEYKMISFYDSVFDNRFLEFIKRKKIDLISVIPNNQPRQINFNDFILNKLMLDFKEYTFWKIILDAYEWRQSQKSTQWLKERIENAKKLFFIKDNLFKSAKNILLIDDVFWSWATMNTVANKIKIINPNVSIIWFSLLWSYRKWFDVANEV